MRSRRNTVRSVGFVLGCAAVLSTAACTSAHDAESARPGGAERTDVSVTDPPPAWDDAPLTPDLVLAVDTLIDRVQYLTPDDALDTIDESGDPRLAWLIVDVLRMVVDPEFSERLVESFTALTGATPDPARPWTSAVDQLMAWDIPAPPGYLDAKRRIHETIDERWAPFFDDNADIDWRHVGWGGVLLDDRELGDPNRCRFGCIPALDDPAVTDADGGSWYPDDALIFGIELNGEFRAYPKNVMEIHEMVNDTIGGRRIAVIYCTLCASAQAYLTERPDGPPYVLRTSGLLQRSNKLTFDLETRSLIDSFTGRALSGPLHDAGVTLEPLTVVTSTWVAWRTEHPETTVVAEDGGILRDYPLDPLRGRDDEGPIFPIGVADPRLDVHESVLGVVIDGEAVAFPVEAARTALADGEPVVLAGVELRPEAGGLVAVDRTGAALVSHQAFWFAWSQFHPDTRLWEG